MHFERRVLVTGGAGFIGSHTCLLLLEKGYELFVIDSYINSSYKALERVLNLMKSNGFYCENKLHLFEGDIRDYRLLNHIFNEAKKSGKNIEGVIHFAGLKAVGASVKSPLDYWDSNVYGTINLLKVMKKHKCRTIIFSSSATIYGITDNNPIREDSAIRPINPYGATKAAIEQLLKDQYNSCPSEWRISSLRYFNPIGAHPSGELGEDPLGTPNNIFPIINNVAAGKIKQLKVFGNDWNTFDGTGVRDYIHVIDLSEGHIEALEYLIGGESQLINFNLGTGIGKSVLELIQTFEDVNKLKVPYIFTKRREGDTSITVADNSLAKSKLNWNPRRNLEDMCKDGWAWQLKNN